jgi:hypothetical protein
MRTFPAMNCWAILGASRWDARERRVYLAHPFLALRLLRTGDFRSLMLGTPNPTGEGTGTIQLLNRITLEGGFAMEGRS